MATPRSAPRPIRPKPSNLPVESLQQDDVARPIRPKPNLPVQSLQQDDGHRPIRPKPPNLPIQSVQQDDGHRPIRPKPSNLPVQSLQQDDVVYIIVMEAGENELTVEPPLPVVDEIAIQEEENARAEYPWYNLFQNAESSHRGWVSSLEDVTRVIRLHELYSNSEFTTYMCRRKNFGNTDITDKSHFIRFNDKFDTQQRIAGLKFDGVPFISVNIKKLDCHRGLNRNVSSQKSDQKRRTVQGTKKVDCPAQITIREIIRFPDHKIEKNQEWKRKQSSKKLRSDIVNNDFKYERRFYIYLPQLSEHKCQAQTGVEESQSPIHEKLKAKIDELVLEGIDSPAEVIGILLDYVNTEKHTLFPDGIFPENTNRCFFPTEQDIQNHITMTISENCQSEFDENNLEKMLEEWKENQNGDNIFFRPHPKQQCKGDMNLQMCKAFLFVYQTVAQKHLLIRYGNEVCLLDSSYKVSKFGIPVYFVCVQTNVDYQPVAAFIILNETVDAIGEALNIIKDWNPEWCLKSFITNFKELEIQAVEKTFPNTVVYLRDSHREQRWDRWVITKTNGVFDYHEEVLHHLRLVAHAETEKEFFKAIDNMKGSSVWNNSPLLQDFFEKCWFPEHRRWAWAFRKDAFIINFKTNNGSEFRNMYMNHQKRTTLIGLLTVLKENFFPAKISCYALKNEPTHVLNRECSKLIPNSQRGRPKKLVLHCSKRLTESQSLKPHHIHKLGEKSYLVNSETDQETYVRVMFSNDFGMPSCECADWKKFRWPCKHFFAIFTHTNDKWEDISDSYINSIFLTLDPTIYIPEIQNIEIESAVTEILSIDLDTDVTIEAQQTQTTSALTAEDCRLSLDEMRSATFNLTEPHIVQEFHQKLESVRLWVSQHTAKEQDTCKRPGNVNLFENDELSKRKREM